ncbi:hypothetical protein QQS21_007275 [Conoideocrella luteorostrata]|uniref:FAD-binding domain-containing protein n=1 Tax=Conoideocrella luteorostrata TaxID=1105319 RepID=A0AAJ0CL19_9HYPO|nr:hypothetical protein QQS21_007275 [Conoideocrella luteorostrata]
MSESIRIAILGGGLAGASLLHALLDYPHLDVHIFESAAEFGEVGARIRVGRNGLAALKLIGDSAAQCLERAGAKPQMDACFMLAQDEEGQDNVIDEARAEDGQPLASIVYRSEFLRELLAKAKTERMHAFKKLDYVEGGESGPLTLHFKDKSTHECDILIGADGIHSTVRKIVLGPDDPAANPRYAGWWTVMTYIDGGSIIGEGPVDIEDSREYIWVGNDTYLLHSVLGRSRLVQAIIYEEECQGSDGLYGMVCVEDIEFFYRGWPPHLNKAVNELLCYRPQQPAKNFWDQPPTRTYVSGRICVVGDAAHATTPWQGAGCDMSIEDTLVLSTLLGRSKNTAQAVVALRVYDQVRRPRTQRIVESSRETGMILTGRGGETGLDLAKLKEKLLPRWAFIVDFDNAKALDEAVQLMDEELAG